MFDLSLICSVLLLGAASALSPGIFAITLALLSGKQHQKTKTIALLIGGALAAALILFVGLNIDDISASFSDFFKPAGGINVVLGVLMLLFGIYSLFPRKDKLETNLKQKPSYLKLALIGFLINITNFDAVLLNFTAMREIDNAKLAFIPETILVFISDLFFLSPTLIPLAMYLLYPEKSKKLLTPVGTTMNKYGNYIVAVIFIGFGLYLLYRAGVLHF